MLVSNNYVKFTGILPQQSLAKSEKPGLTFKGALASDRFEKTVSFKGGENQVFDFDNELRGVHYHNFKKLLSLKGSSEKFNLTKLNLVISTNKNEIEKTFGKYLKSSEKLSEYKKSNMYLVELRENSSLEQFLVIDKGDHFIVAADVFPDSDMCLTNTAAVVGTDRLCNTLCYIP